MKGTRILILSLFVVYIGMPIRTSQVEAAIDCTQVSITLIPCLPYLMDGGMSLPPTEVCCVGLRRLRDMAQAKPDREAICECAKAAASRYPNLKPDAASTLPQKCGVPTNVPVSPNINCHNIP